MLQGSKARRDTTQGVSSITWLFFLNPSPRNFRQRRLNQGQCSWEITWGPVLYPDLTGAIESSQFLFTGLELKISTITCRDVSPQSLFQYVSYTQLAHGSLTQFKL